MTEMTIARTNNEDNHDDSNTINNKRTLRASISSHDVFIGNDIGLFLDIGIKNIKYMECD